MTYMCHMCMSTLTCALHGHIKASICACIYLRVYAFAALVAQAGALEPLPSFTGRTIGSHSSLAPEILTEVPEVWETRV